MSELFPKLNYFKGNSDRSLSSQCMGEYPLGTWDWNGWIPNYNPHRLFSKFETYSISHLQGVLLFDVVFVAQPFVYLPDHIFELQFDECHCHKVKSKYFDAVSNVVGWFVSFCCRLLWWSCDLSLWFFEILSRCAWHHVGSTNTHTSTKESHFHLKCTVHMIHIPDIQAWKGVLDSNNERKSIEIHGSYS